MNTPFGNMITTAEHAIAMMFAVARQIPEANTSTQAGKWEKSRFMGVELTNKTVGVIGAGNIGGVFCERARSLKMKVVAYDPYLDKNNDVWKETKNLELENLLTISDIISLHIPLNKETSNLIDEKKLRLIKDSSVIINTARGGIIDENALAQLLKEDKIGGAALDVFNEEPLKKEHAKKFKGIDNLILTPHIGGVTKESNERVSQMIAKKIDMHLSK